MRRYEDILKRIDEEDAEFPRLAEWRKKVVITKQRTDRARMVLKKHGIKYKEILVDEALDVHKCITFRPYSGKWVNRVTGKKGEGLTTLLIELGVTP